MDWPIVKLRIAIGLLQCGAGTLLLAFLTLSCGGMSQLEAVEWCYGAGLAMTLLGLWLGGSDDEER